MWEYISGSNQELYTTTWPFNANYKNFTTILKNTFLFSAREDGKISKEKNEQSKAKSFYLLPAMIPFSFHKIIQ